MVSGREFWRNFIGGGVIVASMLTCLGIFVFNYLPTFPNQKLEQQVTIVVATCMTTIFTLAIIAMFVTSLIYERPGAQAEE
jgi:Na+/proline symporter